MLSTISSAASRRVLSGLAPAAALAAARVTRSYRWAAPAAPRWCATARFFHDHRLPDTSRVESPIDWSEDRGRVAFAHKATLELVRALAVYRISSIPAVVRSSSLLLGRARALLGDTFVFWVVRHTFFAQFCAGQDAVDIRPTVNGLRELGVASILDYAAEADVMDVNIEDEKPIVLSDHVLQADVEASMELPQARVFPIDIEDAQCDANVQIFLDCVRAVAQFKDGFAAIKVTALGRPVLLERVTNVIETVRELFRSFDTSRDRVVDRREFGDAIEHHLGLDLTTEETDALFAEFDKNGSGVIDVLEWTEHLKPEDLRTRPFFVSARRIPGKEHLLPCLEEHEMEQLDRLMERLHTVAECAAEHKVRLMVDAEQTYFQPAISHTVVNLQRRHNKEFPVIFNTYQAYLKSCYAQIQDDLARAEREGFWFAGKLVRGAYMVAERKRAAERGYEDPICPDIETTHKSYHASLDLILRNIKRSNVMVASHNPDTIKLTTLLMEHYGIARDDRSVFFGQLLGMADSLSFPLGQNGYAAYKYVPYGALEEVIPYLLRRAEENSALLGSAAVQEERALIWQELRRRLFSITRPTI